LAKIKFVVTRIGCRVEAMAFLEGIEKGALQASPLK